MTLRQLYVLGFAGLVACSDDGFNEVLNKLGAQAQEGSYFLPEFTFQDVNPTSTTYNSSVSLNDLIDATYEDDSKTRIIVNFWMYGCGPCMQEMPLLQEVYEMGSAEVVAISSDSYRVFNPDLNEDEQGYDLTPTKRVMNKVTFPVLGGFSEEEETRIFYESMPYFPTIDIGNEEYTAYFFPLTVIMDNSGEVIEHLAGYDASKSNKLLDN